MSQQRRLELATRRGELSALIGFQRTTLAQQAWPVASALSVADRALAGVDWLKRHPLALAVAVVALVIARPRRVWRWSARIYFLWRGWQGLRARLLA